MCGILSRNETATIFTLFIGMNGDCHNSRVSTNVDCTHFAPDTCRMVKKPEPPQPITWTVYKIAKKQTWVGTVEAADEAEAIRKVAVELKLPATKLHVVRR
jgi:hypothetical protein